MGLLAIVLTNCTKEEEFIPDRTMISEIELPKFKSGVVSDLLNLKNDIDSVASVEPMNDGIINSLKIKIDKAIKSLEKDNKTAAVNQLQSLIRQVEGFINAGLCSESQGQTLIDVIIAVIDLIEIPLSSLLAYYPLTVNTEDATGNYPDIIVKNCVFFEGGIYSNGKYIMDDPEGSLIQTPVISGLNLNDFEVSVDFKVTNLDFYFYKPVFIIGNLYREFGFLLSSDQTLSLLLGNNNRYDSDQQFSLDR